MKACKCSELTINHDGKEIRVVPPRWHNCEYIAARNRLINDCCREADRLYQRSSTGWSAVYSGLMEQAAREAGILK